MVIGRRVMILAWQEVHMAVAELKRHLVMAVMEVCSCLLTGSPCSKCLAGSMSHLYY